MKSSNEIIPINSILHKRQKSSQGAQVREAVLQREIAYLLQEHEIFRAQVEALGDAVEAEKARYRSLLHEVAYREHVISVIYASRSWQSTRLLRRVANIVRKCMGKRVGDPPSFTPIGQASSDIPAQLLTRDANSPLARSRSRVHRRILVASDFLPLHDQQSGGLRLKTLIGLMGEAGWSVTFASMAEITDLPGILGTHEGRQRYENVLSGVGVDRFLYGVQEIDAYLAEMGRDLDWAFLSFPATAEQLMPLVRSRCPLARIAYDMVDFHGLRMAREAALLGDTDLLRRADHQRDIELACAKAADVTLAINEEEKGTLLSMVPQAVVEVIPNVFEMPSGAAPPVDGRDGLLFVGGFWHKPNGDAICWFVEKIWPLIRREKPGAVLRIVGSNPTDEVLALGAQPGIEVLGFVPDLAPLIDRSRVSVAPLRYGAGSKGKVGQALAHGLPVVATQVGAEGMFLQDGVHALVADDEQALAAHVVRLLTDNALWTRLSINGRRHMQSSFSTEVVKRQLLEALDG